MAFVARRHLHVSARLAFLKGCRSSQALVDCSVDFIVHHDAADAAHIKFHIESAMMNRRRGTMVAPNGNNREWYIGGGGLYLAQAKTLLATYDPLERTIFSFHDQFPRLYDPHRPDSFNS